MKIHGVDILPAANGVVLSAGGVLVVVPGVPVDEARVSEAARELFAIASRAGADGSIPACDVVVCGEPENRIHAIKVVHVATRVSLSEAKLAIDRLAEGPSAIASGLAYHEAFALKEKFLAEVRGVSASLLPSGGSTRALCPACGSEVSFLEDLCRECGTAAGPRAGNA